MRDNSDIIRQWYPQDPPLNVPALGRLSVQVCNVQNMNVRDHVIPVGNQVGQPGATLIRTPVGNVGTSGMVKVEVFNSANINVNGTLVVGMKINAGQLTGELPDASLISELVKGSLGLYAQVSVRIEDSANVNLQSSSSELWIGKGTLLQEIVNVKPSQYVQNACLEVGVFNSANVRGSGGKVFIRDGQLDDETIDLPSLCEVCYHWGCVPCSGNLGKTDGSRLTVTKQNVANVDGVSTLDIWDGELSDDSVDVGELRANSAVNLNLENVGNAKVLGHIRIADGEVYI